MIIMTDISLILQLFYRQYLFTMCVPELIELFNSLSQLIKQSVLLSLTYLIGSVPKPVLKPHLPKVCTYFIASLIHECIINVL